MYYNSGYLTLVWLTGGVSFLLAYLGYRKSRDTFHPALLIGLQLIYPYFLSPLFLYNKGALFLFLPMGEMAFVQLVYFIGVTFLLMGMLAASDVSYSPQMVWTPHPRVRRSMRRAAKILGAIGLSSYLFMVFRGGGFLEIYSSAHNSEAVNVSGYIACLSFLTYPAITLLFLVTAGKPLRQVKNDLFLIFVFIFPFAFRAVVTGGRGNMFIVVATLATGWYLSRRNRPRLKIVLLGGVALAVLLIIMVTHRNTLHLGAKEFEFKGAPSLIAFMTHESTGNEYIYGSGTVIHANRTGEYQWGARYILKIFVRAIPSFIWPDKYEDVSRFLNIPMNLLADNVESLGWRATGGASPGLLADLWKQFWWFYIPFLYGLGLVIGKIWKRAVREGEFWVVLYVIILSTSLYLTQQTLQAWLWQFLFVGGCSWGVWRMVVPQGLGGWKPIQETGRDEVYVPPNGLSRPLKLKGGIR